MVYSIAWDESTPVGATTLASDIDQVFRDLKISIRERIEDVIPDWDNDGVDPKVLLGFDATSGDLDATRLPSADPGPIIWNTGAADVDVSGGLGWGGGVVIASSDDVGLNAISDITGWFREDITASETNVGFNRVPDGLGTTLNSRHFIAIRPGTIVGIWVTLTEDRTAGTLTVEPAVGLVLGGNVQAIIDGTGASNNFEFDVVAKENGQDFVAGDRIDIRFTTDGAWLPITADARAAIQVIYD